MWAKSSEQEEPTNKKHTMSTEEGNTKLELEVWVKLKARVCGIWHEDLTQYGNLEHTLRVQL